MRRLLAILLIPIAGMLGLAGCDPGDVVTLPSGCVRIHPNVVGGPGTYWYWFNDPYGHATAEIIYDIIPTPDTFIGFQWYPHETYIYNAPLGANQLQRAFNCMLSEGGSQG